MAGRAGGQPGVRRRWCRCCSVLATRLVQLDVPPLERNLDLVAADGGAAVVGRRGPRSRLIVLVPLAVAVRPVGAPGTVAAALSVVASSTLEAVAGAVGVDGRDAVVAGAAGVERPVWE